MPQQTYLIAGFTLAVLAASPALGAETRQGDDVTAVWGAAVNYKTVGFAVGKKEFAPQYVTLDMSLTTAYRGFYLGANYDVSLKDYVTLNNTPAGGGGVDNSIVTFSRQDAGMTFGHNVWKSMNLFVGYRLGETSAHVFSDLTSGARNSSIAFLTKGPFLGASYGFAMGKRGTLLLSAAYAAMLSEVTERSTPSIGAAENRDLEGSANGYSVGIGWTGPLEGTLAYTVAYKFSKYKFRQDNVTDPDDDLSFDEVHNVFTLSVQKYF